MFRSVLNVLQDRFTTVWLVYTRLTQEYFLVVNSLISHESRLL